MPDAGGSSRHFLLEIGVEELPAGELLALSSALGRSLAENLDACGLRHGGAAHFESPRRLAVSVETLASKQADSVREKLGPPLGDEDARAGFARRCGVDPDALGRTETARGARWCLRELHAGQAASELLPGIVERAVSALPVSRRMRWGGQERAFARPVRWLVALLDDEVLPCTLFGVRSGRRTRGHRVHADRWIELGHAAEYLDALRGTGRVLASSAARRDAIRAQVQALDAGLEGAAELDGELLSEVASLVEWPAALTGRFDARFLALPDALLSTVMRKHQKCFSVRAADGSLLARFVAVANLDSREPQRVVAGNERVIGPRLADAEFFLREDSRQALSSHRDSLRGLVFHAQLGSVHEKSERLGALGAEIAGMLGADEDAARRAGELAKADLGTLIVQELPELQGLMGGHYARLSGEDDAVATAIAEHYHPRFANDALPATPIGQAVSLADRIDTLIGILGCGDAPSGSGDPFALRRAALGALRIAIEAERDVDLRAVCELAARQYRRTEWEQDPVAETLAFCRARSRGHFQERGFAVELFRAVAEQAAERPFDAQRRIVALQRFVAQPNASGLIESDKRIANILRAAGRADARPGAPAWRDAPCAAEERRLRAELSRLRETLPELLRRAAYREALAELAALREPLDRFFERVLVMDENPAARENRLALLSGLREAFSQVADFGALSPLTAGAAR